MKRSLLLIALLLGLCSGCVHYSQRYVIPIPEAKTNMVVTVKFISCLHKDTAAELTSHVQLPGVTHDVNTSGLSALTDTESIKAIGTMIGQIAAEAFKSSVGLPTIL